MPKGMLKLKQKLAREVEELRQASEADLPARDCKVRTPSTYAHAQARHAQELKNAAEFAEVVETASVLCVCTIAGEDAAASRRDPPVGAAAFSGTGKPTC
ncbi:terminase small subunit [Escherichia coli]